LVRTLAEETKMIEGIRATGLYLLEVLKSEKVVRYSRFYNNTPGTEDHLVAGAMPFLVDSKARDLETIREEGHVLLEYAAWQLEDLGIVRIEELDENLVDGEPDFKIELTEKGSQVLADGLAFGFHSLNYSIIATPASEWLILLLLEAGGLGIDITLRDVMDLGDSDGDVRIKDDYGNTYRLSSSTFAWAFEVCLWHHARAGHIEPACETAEQEKLWSKFVARAGCPARPDRNAPQPLWHIPFRLVKSVRAGNVEVVHVGRVAS
jgi:hypothetical protein